MKMRCLLCGHDINLDHTVFQEYSGFVKCFSCGAMMEIRTNEGFLQAASVASTQTQAHAEGAVERVM